MGDPKRVLDYLPAPRTGERWTFLEQLAFTVLFIVPLIVAVLAILFLLIFWLCFRNFHPGH
jgi:hypothetical protein